MSTPLATHRYSPGELNAALEFLKRTRAELRTLRKAFVWKDRVHIVDVNRDYFEIQGIGYPDKDVVLLLLAVNTVFDPATIHEPIDGDMKEFDTGRRYPWAYDRVM
jgi:hypothetical protein